MGSNDGDAMQWVILYVGSVVGERDQELYFQLKILLCTFDQ